MLIKQRKINEYRPVDNHYGQLIVVTKGVEIPILIDADDVERVLLLRWTWGGNYAYNGPTRYLLHRYIMNAPTHLLVDHKDRNVLDCRKENLRFATKQGNNVNRGLQSNSTTGFKGVSIDRRINRYIAYANFNGKFLWLGSYDTAEEAAKTYDNRAVELFGDFAVTNESLGLLGKVTDANNT